jgi:hypothetical protein
VKAQAESMVLHKEESESGLDHGIEALPMRLHPVDQPFVKKIS